jgi:hypothetical protein
MPGKWRRKFSAAEGGNPQAKKGGLGPPFSFQLSIWLAG